MVQYDSGKPRPGRYNVMAQCVRTYLACGLFGFFICSILLLNACQSTPRQFVPQPGRDYSLGLMHRVAQGDCLSSIAFYYRRSSKVLAALNELEAPYLMLPGDVLYIPPENNLNILKRSDISLASIRAARRRMLESDVAGPHKYADHHMKVAVSASATKYASVTPPRKSKLVKALSGAASAIHIKKAPKKAAVSFEKDPKKKARKPDRAPGDFIWPVEGQYLKGFDPDAERPCRGVEIAAADGAPIRAAEAGQVLFSGSMPNMGRMVWIDHGKGFVTIYAHTSKNMVARGQKVRKNQTIALVGKSGKPDQPKLHFELRHAGIAVDPEEYLPSYEK